MPFINPSMLNQIYGNAIPWETMEKKHNLSMLSHLEYVSSVIFPPRKIQTTTVDISFLYGVVRTQKPKAVLEIGRLQGKSTFAIASALFDNGYGKIYSVDINDEITNDVRNLIGEYVVFINSSSKDIMTNSQINSIKFDLFFVDGDHSYEMALNDLEVCVSLSNDSARILVHDAENIQVQQAVDTILKKYNFLTDCGTLDRFRIINKEIS
jgi:predicted O-methyltransferase YrrM